MAFVASGSGFTTPELTNLEGDLVTDKKKKLSKASADKKQALSFNSEAFKAKLLIDADSYKNSVTGQSQRIGGIEGFSFDAAETTPSRFSKDTIQARNALQNQKNFVGERLNKDPAEVTIEDINAYGNLTKGKALDMLLEGQSNIPEEANAPGQSTNLDDTLATGPIQNDPQIGIADTGERGFYGRPIIQVQNPVTGKSLQDALNTPEDNAAFNKLGKFGNAKGREKFFDNRAKEQADKQGFTPALRQEEIEADTGANLENTGRLLVDTAKSIAGAIGKRLNTDSSSTDGSTYTEKDFPALLSLGQKKAKRTQLQGKIDDAKTDDEIRAAQDELDSLPDFTDAEKALDTPQRITVDNTRRGRKATKVKTIDSKYDQFINDRTNSIKRKNIDNYITSIKTGNRFDMEESGKIIDKRLDKAGGEFETAKKQFEDGDIAGSALSFVTSAKDVGMAWGDVVLQNPGSIPDYFAESLPYMALAFSGGGTAVIAEDFYQGSIDEYMKNNDGKLPSDSEAARMGAFSVAAAYTERLGIKGMGLLKGKSGPPIQKLAKELSDIAVRQGKGELSAQAAKNLGQKAVREAAALSTSKATREAAKSGVRKGVEKTAKNVAEVGGKFGKGTFSEGVSESTEELLNTVGQTGDFSNVTGRKLLESGVAGSLGGTGPSAASAVGSTVAKTVSTDTVKKGTKAISDTALKAGEKGQEAIKEFTKNKDKTQLTELDTATDTESSAYDPIEASKAITNSYSRGNETTRQDALNKIEDVTNDIDKKIEVAKNKHLDAIENDASQEERDVIKKERQRLKDIKDSLDQKFAPLIKRESQKSTKKVIDTIGSTAEVGKQPTKEDEQEVIDAIASGEVSGTDDINRIKRALDKNKNISTETKELVDSAVKADESVNKLKDATDKDGKNIHEEVLGDGTNENGQPGLLKHAKDIRSAINSGDYKEAKKRIKRLAGFVKSQKEKYESIKNAEVGATVPYGKKVKGKEQSTFDVRSDGERNGFLKKFLDPEIEALEDELNLSNNLLKGSFNVDAKTVAEVDAEIKAEESGPETSNQETTPQVEAVEAVKDTQESTPTEAPVVASESTPTETVTETPLDKAKRERDEAKVTAESDSAKAKAAQKAHAEVTGFTPETEKQNNVNNTARKLVSAIKEKKAAQTAGKKAGKFTPLHVKAIKQAEAKIAEQRKALRKLGLSNNQISDYELGKVEPGKIVNQETTEAPVVEDVDPITGDLTAEELGLNEPIADSNVAVESTQEEVIPTTKVDTPTAENVAVDTEQEIMDKRLAGYEANPDLRISSTYTKTGDSAFHKVTRLAAKAGKKTLPPSYVLTFNNKTKKHQLIDLFDGTVIRETNNDKSGMDAALDAYIEAKKDPDFGMNEEFIEPDFPDAPEAELTPTTGTRSTESLALPIEENPVEATLTPTTNENTGAPLALPTEDTGTAPVAITTDNIIDAIADAVSERIAPEDQNLTLPIEDEVNDAIALALEEEITLESVEEEMKNPSKITVDEVIANENQSKFGDDSTQERDSRSIKLQILDAMIMLEKFKPKDYENNLDTLKQFLDITQDDGTIAHRDNYRKAKLAVKNANKKVHKQLTYQGQNTLGVNTAAGRVVDLLSNMVFYNPDINSERDALIESILADGTEVFANDAAYEFYKKYRYPTSKEANLDNKVDTSNLRNAEKQSVVAEKLQDINVTADTKQRSPMSLFGLIPNLINSMSGTNLAKDIGKILTGEEKVELKALRALIQDYRENYLAVLAGKRVDGKKEFKANLSEAPLLLMRDAEGNLPQNIIDASIMVALDWVTTQGVDTKFNINDDINRIMGRDTNKPIFRNASQLFRETGLPMTVIISQLGAEIMKQANIRVNNDAADGTFKSRLEDSLGRMAIMTLVDAGALEINQVTAAQFSAVLPKDADTALAQGEDKINFVRFKESPGLNQMVEDSKNPNRKSAVKKLFNMTESATGPVDTVPKSIDTRMGRTISELSEDNAEDLQHAQEQEWTVKENVLGFINRMSTESMQAIGGFVENLDSVTENDEAGTIGRNDQIVRGIGYFMDFVADRTPGKAFFFNYKAIKNNRSMIQSNRVNPQANKMHRHSIGAKAWDTEIDTNNEDHRNAMMLAIGAALGLKVDKKMHSSIYTDFVAKIMDDDGNVNEAFAEAVTLINSNKKQFTEAEQEVIVEAVRQGGEEYMSMDGLIALAEYKKALDSKGKFITNLTRETDGITNGVITSVFQLVNNVEVAKDITTNGGVHYKDRPAYDSHGEYQEAPGTLDAYEHVAKSQYIDKVGLKDAIIHEVAENDAQRTEHSDRIVDLIIVQGKGGKELVDTLNAVDRVLDKFVKDVDPQKADIIAITSEGRKEVKPSVMTTPYSKGVESIVNDSVDNAVESILSKLHSLTESTLDSDKEALANFITDLGIITGVQITPTDNRGFKFTGEQENILRKYLDIYHGQSLGVGIQKYLGDINEHRAYMNLGVQVMQHIFKYYYDKAVAEATANNGNLPISQQERTEIHKALRDAGLNPGIKHASSKSETYSDSLDMTKVGKEKIKRELAGRSVTRMPKAQTVNQISLDENDNRIINTENEQTTVGNMVSVANPTKEIGVGGWVQAIISADGNVNNRLMGEAAMLNIFDAGVYGVLDTDGNTQLANETYGDINFNWNAAEELRVSVKRMTDYVVSESDQNMYGNLKIFLPGEMKPTTVNRFLDNFNNKVDIINDSREALINDPDSGVESIEQFQNTGSKAVISARKTVKGDSQADVNAVVDSAMDNTRQDDHNAKILEMSKKTTVVSGKTLNKNKLTKDEKAFYNDNKAAIDGMLPGNPNNISGSQNTDSLSTQEITDVINETKAQAVNSDTVEQLFEELEDVGNVTDSTVHTNRLKNLINKVLTPALNQLGHSIISYRSDKKNVANASGFITKNNRILVTFTPVQDSVNDTDLSSQEVFTHEVTHALWRHGIDNNPKVRKEVTRLFRLAEKAFKGMPDPWKMFLKNANPTDAEIQSAKDRYSHIMTNPDGYLHEFAVFGLTNAAFIAALDNVLDAPEKATPKTLTEKLKAVFQDIVDWIGTKFYADTRRGTVSESLYELATTVETINTSNNLKLPQIGRAINEFNGKLVSGLSEYVYQPYSNYVEKSIAEREKKMERSIMDIVKSNTIFVPHYVFNKKYAKRVNDFVYRWGITKNNMVHKLLKEVAGAKLSELSWHKLLRKSKHELDSARKNIIDLTTLQVKEMFDPEVIISEQEWEHMTAALLKTDFSLLVTNERTAPNLINLLRDNSKLQAEIDIIENELNNDFGVNSKYYRMQSESLGHYMARGRVGLKGQMLNANNIAKLYMTSKVRLGDISRAEFLIDELASLYAIKYTDHKSKATAVKFMQHEWKRKTFDDDGDAITDGISHMLNVHKNFKKQSLDSLFKGQPEQVVKGYTSEGYDPNLSVKIGNASDEADMKAQGYKLVGEVQRDKYDRTTGGQLYAYVSNNKDMSSLVAGVVSYTSKTNKGADTLDVLNNDDPDNRRNNMIASLGHNKRMFRNVKRDTDALFNGSVALDFESNHMVPILDAEGNPTNFRYLMTEDAKKNLLNKKDLANESLGRMMGSILDKNKSEEINKLAVEQSKEDFDDEYAENPRDFIYIGPDAKDKKMRELYALLPAGMRNEIHQVWGKENLPGIGQEDGMYIKEELLDMIFGFHKLSLTDGVNGLQKKLTGRDMPYMMTQVMKQSGLIWQTVIARAKRNIVILIPKVLAANVTSNFSISVMSGIPLEYSIKKQAEGITAIIDYKRLAEERDRLQNILDSDPNVVGRNNKERKIARLTADMKANPISTLIDEGLFQAIVEDIEDIDTAVPDQLINALPILGKFKESGVAMLNGNMAGRSIIRGYEHAILSPSTKAGDALMKATQYSDLVARYAMYSYRTEVQGRDADVALQEVIDSFVNYDVNTSPQMQWLNDMGIMMFTKFLFRIQRVILRVFRENPARVLTQKIMEEALVDIPDIYESNLITNEYIQRVIDASPTDRIDAAFEINALNYIPDIF